MTDIYVNPNVDLKCIDGIIFDCDGVLIDVRKSYDSTIQKTIQHITESMGVQYTPITPDIINGFKNTGGFNDEIDLTYIAILCLITSHNTKKDPLKLIHDVTQNSTGLESAENYLRKTFDINNIKKKLDYPGRHGILHKTFDRFFYGSELIFELFGEKVDHSKGLIKNDLVLVDVQLMIWLKERFGDKISLVTGRGLQSIKYSLGHILDKFDISNAFFLEDEPRELAKPNPETLRRCMSGMGSKHCLYVGDSLEDYIMANQVSGVVFCGITGTNDDPKRKELFKDAGAILDSIHFLPKLFSKLS